MSSRINSFLLHLNTTWKSFRKMKMTNAALMMTMITDMDMAKMMTLMKTISPKRRRVVIRKEVLVQQELLDNKNASSSDD